MLRRREQHVLETPEHVRPDCVALIAARERCDENFCTDRHAQMIRPERNQSLDERTIARHACCQCSAAFRGGDVDERATRHLARLAPLLLIACQRARLPNHAERADGMCNRRRRGLGRRVQERCVSLELSAEPLARIGHAPPFTGAGAETESIQRAKSCIHKSPKRG